MDSAPEGCLVERCAEVSIHVQLFLFSVHITAFLQFHQSIELRRPRSKPLTEGEPSRKMAVSLRGLLPSSVSI